MNGATSGSRLRVRFYGFRFFFSRRFAIELQRPMPACLRPHALVRPRSVDGAPDPAPARLVALARPDDVLCPCVLSISGPEWRWGFVCAGSMAMLLAWVTYVSACLKTVLHDCRPFWFRFDHKHPHPPPSLFTPKGFVEGATGDATASVLQQREAPTQVELTTRRDRRACWSASSFWCINLYNDARAHRTVRVLRVLRFCHLPSVSFVRAGKAVA